MYIYLYIHIYIYIYIFVSTKIVVRPRRFFHSFLSSIYFVSNLALADTIELNVCIAGNYIEKDSV